MGSGKVGLILVRWRHRVCLAGPDGRKQLTEDEESAIDQKMERTRYTF